MAENWRERIQRIYRSKIVDCTRFPRFRPAASSAGVARMESWLGLKLPVALKELLLESDGVKEMMRFGGEVAANTWLIWPVEEIAEENLRLRAAEDMNAESTAAYLFFANAGVDGVLFGCQLSSGQADERGVYA